MAAQITPLPVPPSRQDPENFSARADAFLGALPAFQSEANALAIDVEQNTTQAFNSAASALASANAAAASLDSFDDRYLGAKNENPMLDNDGQPLLVGALYYNTVVPELRVYNGTNWVTASVVGGTVQDLTVLGIFVPPDNSIALGTKTTGNYVADVNAGAAITVTGVDGEGAVYTVAHADTSNQASVNNSGNTVIQDITLDDFGHLTGIVSTTITSVDSATNATNSANVQVDADETTNATHFVVFTGAATGNQRLNSDSTLTYNPSTNTLTVGTVSGDFSGSVSATTITASGNATIAGDVAVNGGDVTTTATTFNLVNATATTVNLAGAASAMTVGASNAGTLTLRNNVVDVSGTGALKLSVGTTAQRPTPAIGHVRYNTTLATFEGYNGTIWGPIGGGAVGGGTDQIFNLNDQTVTTNYTIPTGKNAVSAGPITINNGVTVTVSNGSNWAIV